MFLLRHLAFENWSRPSSRIVLDACYFRLFVFFFIVGEYDE